MMDCKICNSIFEDAVRFSKHLQFTHKIKSKTYFNTYIEDKKICIECGVEEANWVNLYKGYGDFCSKSCCNKSKERISKIFITKDEKYGRGWFTVYDKLRKPKQPKVKADKNKATEKRRQTCLEKYGVEHVMHVKEFRDRVSNLLKGRERIGLLEIRIQNGKSIPLEERTEWDLYKSKVWKITRIQPIHLLENFDKPRGLNGVDGAYQLDHIISIKSGYINGINPEIIGSVNNLRFIPWKENLEKGWQK